MNKTKPALCRQHITEANCDTKFSYSTYNLRYGENIITFYNMSGGEMSTDLDIKLLKILKICVTVCFIIMIKTALSNIKKKY